MIEIKPYIEHAVLVGLITPNQPEDRTKEYLDELAFLADTHGIVPVKRFTQRLNLPITATYVGEGKLEEIDQYIQEHHPIDVVIFDDELSPRQIRCADELRQDAGGDGAFAVHASALDTYVVALGSSTRRWRHQPRYG